MEKLFQEAKDEECPDKGILKCLREVWHDAKENCKDIVDVLEASEKRISELTEAGRKAEYG
jgi:hypothetical protein